MDLNTFFFSALLLACVGPDDLGFRSYRVQVPGEREPSMGIPSASLE